MYDRYKKVVSWLRTSGVDFLIILAGAAVLTFIWYLAFIAKIF